MDFYGECYKKTSKYRSFVLFGLSLYAPVNNFSVMSGRSHRFLVITITFLGGKCILLKETIRRSE